jgi:hypothetical protein
MILTKIGWATFWATISQTHLAALDLAFRGSAKMTILMIATIQPVYVKKWIASTTACAGLPDFSWYNIPKWGKYTKCPHYIPSVHNIYQMSTIYTKCPQYMYTKWH